jgi:hypothetical protein
MMKSQEVQPSAPLARCLAGLLGKQPDEISAGQVSYDLRRLRAHGLITRIPKPTATESPTPDCTTPC